MKRSGIRRRAPLTTGRRQKRKPSETQRVYGPAARRAWVKTLPCVACGEFASDAIGREMDNMHINSGGVGRKAGYEKIVPCHRVHHEEAHRIGVRSFQTKYNIDLELAAIATEQQWQAYLARTR